MDYLSKCQSGWKTSHDGKSRHVLYHILTLWEGAFIVMQKIQDSNSGWNLIFKTCITETGCIDIVWNLMIDWFFYLGKLGFLLFKTKTQRSRCKFKSWGGHWPTNTHCLHWTCATYERRPHSPTHRGQSWELSSVEWGDFWWFTGENLISMSVQVMNASIDNLPIFLTFIFFVSIGDLYLTFIGWRKWKRHGPVVEEFVI